MRRTDIFCYGFMNLALNILDLTVLVAPQQSLARGQWNDQQGKALVTQHTPEPT